MREAEVIKGAGLRKSVRINEVYAVKNSLVAVHIIRGTKLSIDGARRAAGDAVAASKPGPSNGITDRDICCRRRERQTIYPNRNIENLTARWNTAHSRPAILIDNMNGVGGGLFLLRCDDVSVARLSLRRKHERKRQCQGESDSCCCV
jgi:hypothetical protein